MRPPWGRHSGAREARARDLSALVRRWMDSGPALTGASRNDRVAAMSEILHPRPQLHLPAPGAARLLQHAPIAGGDGVGVEHRIRSVRRVLTGGAPDATIDHEMRDVNALRRQLARHALRKAAQRELAHRERRRLRVALDAGRGAGEQDRAMLVRQHALRRLLCHQEAPESGHRHRLSNFCRHEIDEFSAGPAARVVDHEIGRADFALDQAEQSLDLFRIGGVTGIGASAGLVAERAELLDLARSQRDANVLAGEQPRQRGAEALAGADDQGNLVGRTIHRSSSNTGCYASRGRAAISYGAARSFAQQRWVTPARSANIKSLEDAPRISACTSF